MCHKAASTMTQAREATIRDQSWREGHEHAQEATGKDKNTDLALDDRAGCAAFSIS